MMRQIAWTVVGLCWLLPSCELLAAEEARSAGDAGQISEAWRARIETALQKKTSLEFAETSLRDVADFVQDKARIPVLLDAVSLDDAGLPADAPITCSLHDMSFRSSLRHILADLGLTYTLRDGAVVITTPEDVEARLETRVFEVQDLVRPRDDATADQSDFDSLISLVTKVIAPPTWDTVGGPGCIEAYGNGLVISQTQECLERVRQLLACLREAKRLSAEAKDEPPWVVRVQQVPPDTAEAEIHRALSRDIRVSFQQTPLQHVVDFLREQTNVNILIDSKALDEIGIGADAQVTLDAPPLPLRFALNHVLKPLGLTWLIRDEALVITSPAQGESRTDAAAYPVADLLGRPGELDLFGKPRRMPDQQDLADLITSTTSPESWETVGGLGSIAYCPQIDVLVISQTGEIHEQVGDLLTRLRRTKASKEQDAARSPPAEGQKTRLVIYRLPQPSIPPPGAGLGSGVPWPPISEDQLAKMVCEFIEPASWRQGDVKCLAAPGCLIIQHTDAVHRKVNDLLAELNVMSIRQPSIPPAAGTGGGMGGGMF